MSLQFLSYAEVTVQSFVLMVKVDFFFFGKDIIFSLEIIQTLRLSKQKKQ